MSHREIKKLHSCVKTFEKGRVVLQKSDSHGKRPQMVIIRESLGKGNKSLMWASSRRNRKECMQRLTGYARQ